MKNKIKDGQGVKRYKLNGKFTESLSLTDMKT